MEFALELANISKQFGATRALDGVDLSVAHGEVHALVGENGSGKSTLIKVLAGVHEPEPGGTLVIDGAPVPLPMPAGAFHDVGLSFVHQDLGLARPLTVLENLVGAAARQEYSRVRVNWRAEAAEGPPDARVVRRHDRPAHDRQRAAAGRPGTRRHRPRRRGASRVSPAHGRGDVRAGARRTDRLPSRGGAEVPLRPHPRGRRPGFERHLHLARSRPPCARSPTA